MVDPTTSLVEEETEQHSGPAFQVRLTRESIPLRLLFKKNEGTCFLGSRVA